VSFAAITLCVVSQRMFIIIIIIIIIISLSTESGNFCVYPRSCMGMPLRIHTEKEVLSSFVFLSIAHYLTCDYIQEVQGSILLINSMS
jgi:hypothetical protein